MLGVENFQGCESLCASSSLSNTLACYTKDGGTFE